MSTRALKLAVFISGTGSNFKAIHTSLKNNSDVEICCVVSNNPDAIGLEYAKANELNIICQDHKTFESRQAHEQAIINELEKYQPDLIILAGYMRVFTAYFIEHFDTRMINIHPSLLPLYKGLNTHQRVLEDFNKGNQTHHGCSVHWVSAGVDEGRVIAQAQLAIAQEDTADSLRQRVHILEHKLYPIVVALLLQKSETIRYNKSNNIEELLEEDILLFEESQLIAKYDETFEIT